MKIGQLYLFYSETCVLGISQVYIVAYLSARERECGQVTKIFNLTKILPYNGDIPMVQ